MSAHTEGRLAAGQFQIAQIGKAIYHGIAVPGEVVPIAVTGPTGANDAAIACADARRLAACWNALERVPTEEIEQARRMFELLDEKSREVFTLRAENDRLAIEVATAVAAVPNGAPFIDHNELVRSMAEDIVRVAGILGVVLTITQVARQPLLAMGNYRTVVQVRAARERAQ